jgi:hypothetical protein
MSTPATDLESRIKALEAKAQAEGSKLWAFIKAHWAHFVTWLGLFLPTILKHL